jgi:3-(3-hydroxy-phenyl)propionate hydroxylase
MSNANHTCEVAIVGMGPTGVMLAHLLGALGVDTVLMDREPDLINLPRAVHFDGEVMRIFQNAGLATALLPDVRASQGMQYINPQGQLLLERKPATAAGMHGWANNYLFHQPDVERILRDGLAAHPSVQVRLHHEVTDLQATPTGVDLAMADLSQHTTPRLHAQWVVGCDGARSQVREHMATGLDDLGLHQAWLVIDVELRQDLDLPVATVQYCNPARPITYVNVTGRRRRWEVMVMPGDNLEQMTEPAHIWPLLSPWIKPEQATLVRTAIYTFHSLLTQHWRQGRLLLAGDSAHQTPPFLGQGMCAGIRDAANLAWKLHRVCRGAPEALLDTYASERMPHVSDFIATAVKLGNIIQSTDPVVAAQRDQQFLAQGPQEIVNLSPPLGPGFHQGLGLAGQITAQPRLSDGRLLDDALGQGFAVVTVQAMDTSRVPAQTLNDLTALGTQWLHDPALHDWLQGLDALCVLLRPDRYVFATAQSAQEMVHWDLSLALTQHSTAPHHPSPSPTVEENRP